MKINNSVKIMCGAFTLAALTMACSKKTADVQTEDNSSKIVTGTMEVDSQIQDFADTLKDFESTIEKELESVIEDSDLGLIDIGDANFNKMSDSLNDAKDSILSTVETLTNSETYTNALESAKETLNSTLDNLKNSEAVESITNTLDELKNTDFTKEAKDALNSLKDIKLDEETKDALDSLKDLGGLLGF